MPDRTVTILPSPRRQIAADQAHAAYDILVAHAGAYEGGRDSFVIAVSDAETPCDEYRFCGSLGFGGKFRNNGNRDGVPYIDCYREHETPDRIVMIQLVNGLLRNLFSVEESR